MFAKTSSQMCDITLNTSSLELLLHVLKPKTAVATQVLKGYILQVQDVQKSFKRIHSTSSGCSKNF